MNSWTSERALEASRAFMESRIVLTGVELDVFTLLAHAPLTLDEAASAMKSSSRGTAILLDALTAMGLLVKSGGRYACAPGVAEMLSADAPESVLPMMRHAASLWERWSQLTQIVREGTAARSPQVFQQKEELEAFIGAMHVVGRRAAAAIAEAAKAEASTRLLDIGGATGTYAEAFLRKYPAMRATVFDRPPVIELARKRLAATDLMDRIELAAGDFYADELPGGHDLALLSAIIHQNSPEQNLDLYTKSYRALTPGGRLLIRDHVMNADRTEPAGGALFAVNMLAATAGGNCYTFDEIRDTLHEAGFANVRLIQTGNFMDGLVEAFKPE